MRWWDARAGVCHSVLVSVAAVMTVAVCIPRLCCRCGRGALGRRRLPRFKKHVLRLHGWMVWPEGHAFIFIKSKCAAGSGYILSRASFQRPVSLARFLADQITPRREAVVVGPASLVRLLAGDEQFARPEGEGRRRSKGSGRRGPRVGTGAAGAVGAGSAVRRRCCCCC